MLSVRQSQTGSSGRSLVVGKYISRRALLRYEQSLKTAGESLLSLEYWLARNLELITYIGRQTDSGVELNWARDY